MSVVCCKIDKDRIHIASDSITVRGWTQSRGNNTTFSKLFSINQTIIGSSGTVEEASLLQIFCQNRTPFNISPKNITNRDVLSFLDDFSKWKKSRTDNGKIENSYILAAVGKVFHINGFMIQEITTYEAIGAGTDFALSALYLGQNVESAVETACELSVFCEKPIIYYIMELTPPYSIRGGSEYND